MRHPTEGTLRRLLDEPAGVAEPDREHVTGCPVCLARLAEVREDAAVTRDALDAAPDADVDAAWRRLSQAVTASNAAAKDAAASGGGGRLPAAIAVPRWRAALRRPVVAAVGVGVLVAGAGAAAAADWLQIFRTEEIAPVTVTRDDLVELPDLSAYGDLDVLEEPDPRPVADAAAAEEATGLSVPEVRELPRGVTGEPRFQVGGQVSAEFTFSAEKAADAAAANGATLPPPPPELDGSTFRLEAGPGVAAVWQEARGVPAMIVARVIAPTAYSSGVPFDVARDYLLSLPGLPEDVAAQLRSFSGDGTVLPLAVPADHVRTSTAEVDGVAATVLTSRDGTMTGVVWVEDGVATAVAGSLSTDEVLAVARGLGS